MRFVYEVNTLFSSLEYTKIKNAPIHILNILVNVQLVIGD